jgi:hypothetical protein
VLENVNIGLSWNVRRSVSGQPSIHTSATVLIKHLRCLPTVLWISIREIVSVFSPRARGQYDAVFLALADAIWRHLARKTDRIRWRKTYADSIVKARETVSKRDTPNCGRAITMSIGA